MPCLLEWLSSVQYLFSYWDNKNIDWWFPWHLNLRKHFQPRGAAKAKKPDASTGNNFQGLKYGFYDQSPEARNGKKSLFNWSPALFFPDQTRLCTWESKENLRLWELLRSYHFLLQNIQMLKVCLIFPLSELQCREVLLLSEKYSKR